MFPLRTRQIHLDFHTSERIPGIGSNFDPDEFAETLKQAAVNSVTVFGKCHHGWSYFPTKVGKMHPHLDFDLLGEMIEACHKRDILTPVYTTIVWDELAARNKDWRQINKNGEFVGNEFEPCWHWLCPNPESPYVDYFEEHTAEIIKNYDIDGLFLDILMITAPGCVCRYCLDSMRKKGLNPESDQDLEKHALLITRGFMDRMKKLFVKLGKKHMRIFFNSRLRICADVGSGGIPELKKYYTVIEIESLPSGKWGYDHFPFFASYFSERNLDMLSHTGRFHTTWGDFGSLKNRVALEYECFRMLANGVKCLVGDQLHPTGKVNKITYNLIGSVYKQVEEIENYAFPSKGVYDIGVLISDKLKNVQANFDSDYGAMRMLMEMQYQFKIIDREQDFSKYKVLLLPDQVLFNEKLAHKFFDYIKKGGKALLSYYSGFDSAKNDFNIVTLPIKSAGGYEYIPHYFYERSRLGLEDYDYVMHEKALKVTVPKGASVLACMSEPYFNRTWQHFCSHQHTPPARRTKVPEMLRKGNIIYIASSVFSAYRLWGNHVYKKFVKSALGMLLEEPVVKGKFPSTVEVKVRDQAGRRLVHLLHYVPQRRANIDIVEDILPLHDITLSVKMPKKTKRIHTVRAKQELNFERNRDYLTFTVPVINGYEVAVIDYKT